MTINNSDKLVGTWRLVSASSTTSSGERNEAPYGLKPVGVLTYTEDGRMSALISYDGRKPIALGATSPALLEQQAAAFKTFLAYAGRYRMNGEDVIHFVEISSIQNWVSTELVRRIRFQDDQIILVTPPTRSDGRMQTFELVWQRLRADS